MVWTYPHPAVKKGVKNGRKMTLRPTEFLFLFLNSGLKGGRRRRASKCFPIYSYSYMLLLLRSSTASDWLSVGWSLVELWPSLTVKVLLPPFGRNRSDFFEIWRFQPIIHPLIVTYVLTKKIYYYLQIVHERMEIGKEWD